MWPIQAPPVAHQELLGYNFDDNFIPFYSIRDILAQDSLLIAFKQIGGNILLLLPLGFFVSLIYKKSFLKIFFIGFLFSVAIEVLQFIMARLFLMNRSADIDDIILNCVGYVLGIMIFKGYEFFRKTHLTNKSFLKS